MYIVWLDYLFYIIVELTMTEINLSLCINWFFYLIDIFLPENLLKEISNERLTSKVNFCLPISTFFFVFVQII